MRKFEKGIALGWGSVGLGTSALALALASLIRRPATLLAAPGEMEQLAYWSIGLAVVAMLVGGIAYLRREPVFGYRLGIGLALAALIAEYAVVAALVLCTVGVATALAGRRAP